MPSARRPSIEALIYQTPATAGPELPVMRKAIEKTKKGNPFAGLARDAGTPLLSKSPSGAVAAV